MKHRGDKPNPLGRGAAGATLLFLILCLHSCVWATPVQEQPLAPTVNNIEVETTRYRPVRLRPAYIPAPIEAFMVHNSSQAKLDAPAPEIIETCHLWKDRSASPYFEQMRLYIEELEEYFNRVDALRLSVDDIRRELFPRRGKYLPTVEGRVKPICEKVKLHPEGLPGLFYGSGQLSRSRYFGWIEPLTTPFRHPKFCLSTPDVPGWKHKFNVTYLIHDFYFMCKRLKPHSRTVFVDMGASLSFHKYQKPPIVELLELYEKFGIRFDHIYAFEITPKEPKDVFEAIPSHMKSAYHWYNVGVSSDPDSDNNPLKMIKDNFDEDDLIIVKLDIDTNDIEIALTNQILNDPKLYRMIDHFYFEYHVRQKELWNNWKHMAEDSVKDAFNLFYKLREKGVASHFWV